MKPSTADTLLMHFPGDEPGGPGAVAGVSSGVPRGIVARRLVAVPWRHAGLIAVCTVAGGLASAMPWLHPAPDRVAAVKPRLRAIQDAPPSALAGIALRLDLELDPGGAAAAPTRATRTADAAQAPSAALQADNAREPDEIDAVMRQAPPAAGRLVQATRDPAPAPVPERPDLALPGLVAGLLLGLLAAALRELGGQRMRSPREAEWALGVPVLGAIPTLSTKAREALLERPRALPDAA